MIVSGLTGKRAHLGGGADPQIDARSAAYLLEFGAKTRGHRLHHPHLADFEINSVLGEGFHHGTPPKHHDFAVPALLHPTLRVPHLDRLPS